MSIESEFDFSVADRILRNHDARARDVIAILQELQEHYRYLPKPLFAYLSERMGLSEASLYSVATFYENFSLEPKGKYVIKVCDGTACHVRKSVPILDRLRSELQLKGGQTTTPDLGFTVETVSCLGACGLAPVITVNDKVYPAMTPEKTGALLNELKEELRNAIEA